MKLEKKEISKDITFEAFVKDNASNMFGLDRRLWKTLKWLLFHPGKLTKAYVSGSHNQFTAPTTLYFSINFLFFFLQPMVNSGKIKLLNFGFRGFTASEGFRKNWIMEDMVESGLSEIVYQVKFDAFITFNQPALIIIIIPFLALFIWLIEGKSSGKFIHHTVHAFHFMTSYLIVFLLVGGLSNVISWGLSEQFLGLNQWLFPISLICLLLFVIIYWAISFRHLRNQNWGICLLKSIGVSIGFSGVMLVYVNLLLLWTIFSVG